MGCSFVVLGGGGGATIVVMSLLDSVVSVLGVSEEVMCKWLCCNLPVSAMFGASGSPSGPTALSSHTTRTLPNSGVVDGAAAEIPISETHIKLSGDFHHRKATCDIPSTGSSAVTARVVSLHLTVSPSVCM